MYSWMSDSRSESEILAHFKSVHVCFSLPSRYARVDWKTVHRCSNEPCEKEKCRLKPFCIMNACRNRRSPVLTSRYSTLWKKRALEGIRKHQGVLVLVVLVFGTKGQRPRGRLLRSSIFKIPQISFPRLDSEFFLAAALYIKFSISWLYFFSRHTSV